MSDNPLKIINEIVAPDLTDERFSDSLNEAFALINDNFKKIVSAPIYRGQQGENTKIKEVAILDGNQFTDEGKKIVKVIFEDANLDEWDGGFESLKTILAGINKYKPIGSKSAVDYFTANDKILMFYLDNVEETLLAPAQLYIFQDERVGDITDTTDGFEDMTCFVSFEWDAENKTYTYVKAEQFPTIAWSTAMGDYVWKINGQLTNIIAKGLKGADAHFYIPMFKVVPQDGYFWNAVAIYVDNGWQELMSSNMEGLSIGMTSIAYILPDGSSDPNTDPTGIEITSLSQFVREGRCSATLVRQNAAIEAKTLDTMLMEIRPAGNTIISDSTPAGLYIPSKLVGDDNDMVHALWRGTNVTGVAAEANFGYVLKTNEGHPDFNITIPVTLVPTILNIHNYQTIKFKQNNEEYGYIKVNDGNDKLKIGNNNSNAIFNENYAIIGYNNTKIWFGTYDRKNKMILSVNGIDVSGSDPNQAILITNDSKPYVTVKGMDLNVGGDFKIFNGSNNLFNIVRSSSTLDISLKTMNLNSNYDADTTINIGKSGKTAINIKGKNIKINDYDFTYPYSNGNWTEGGTNKLKPYRMEYRDIDKNGKDWTTASSDTNLTKYSIEVAFQSFGRFGFFRVLNIESYWRNNEKGPTPNNYEVDRNKYGTYDGKTYTWDVYDGSDNYGLNRSRVVRLYYDVTEFFKTNEVQYIPNVGLGNYVPGNVGIYSGYMGCGIHITASIGYIPVEIAGVTKNRVILHICISHDYVLGYIHTKKERQSDVKDLDCDHQYISYGFDHSLGNASFPIPIKMVE